MHSVTMAKKPAMNEKGITIFTLFTTSGTINLLCPADHLCHPWHGCYGGSDDQHISILDHT
ncbi:hypothetical protein BMS3Abin11_02429 [bacterium BMS3Abin11]|nr:hypothetical protein BMS3Abin11_02429 [bacterium BMS3Abin11]